ncbi:MAG: hypothetical protein NW220_18825 [Leptolyngbyaceae cyanobacterium bins.349]|nr:hypothetical protein [Leptolyngbyaceae cyanobacterium bins.349]
MQSLIPILANLYGARSQPPEPDEGEDQDHQAASAVPDGSPQARSQPPQPPTSQQEQCGNHQRCLEHCWQSSRHSEQRCLIACWKLER